MFYTVYQITNKINGKIYIGKHQTKDLNDGYTGSGKHLKYAISKYGIENFEKEIIFQFDNEADMNAKEAELVTEEFCSRQDTYNLCPGGKGGFGYINKNVITEEMKSKRAKSGRKKADAETIKKRGSLDCIYKNWSEAGPSAVKMLYETDPEFRKKHNENLEKARKLAHSKESSIKRKKTFSKMKHSQGINNSQYGTMWITDGETSIKIKKNEYIPEGWRKGRK